MMFSYTAVRDTKILKRNKLGSQVNGSKSLVKVKHGAARPLSTSVACGFAYLSISVLYIAVQVPYLYISVLYIIIQMAAASTKAQQLAEAKQRVQKAFIVFEHREGTKMVDIR
jgi:hypothetical protein